ncbi:MAG: uroporphyrinogen-III synthase [Gemmataceae bacterium]|nr:uroporphyrinogen-III synthase [Gemmataceae bacterium]
MSSPLTGRTFALAEGRQLEDLASLLEKEGAAVVRCPLLSILDAPDDKPLLEWIEDLINDRFVWVIFLTGEGVRRLEACAQRHGLRDGFIAGLTRTKILTRGPKPVQALKNFNVKPTRIAATPTTDGVIAALKDEGLQALPVGVQLYKEDNPPLISFLDQLGATTRTVLPYIIAPSADTERVIDLMGQMAAGKVDMILFTSSPQIDRLFEVAEEKEQTPILMDGLAKTQVAAVGPIVAETLKQRNVRIDVMPEQGWQMKNMVQHIVRHFAAK